MKLHLPYLTPAVKDEFANFASWMLKKINLSAANQSGTQMTAFISTTMLVFLTSFHF